MSAKGLPPAVRLDPLPLPLTCPSGNMIHFNGASQTQKMATTSTCTTDSNLYSPRPQTQTLARGLTPIIITPESSLRPHTPAAGGSDRGTPGLTSMHTLTTRRRKTGTQKKLKFEIKVEPVELDPILPSVAKRQGAMAVSMDEDEGTQLPQFLPTPCMTPVLHPVDLIKGERGVEGGEFGDKSPRTGRAILPAFRPRCDDPGSDRHVRNPSLSDLADVAERERLVYDHEDGKRGRTRERRRNSRFRERYKPYDRMNFEIQSGSKCQPLPAPAPTTSTMPASHPPHVSGTTGTQTPIAHQPTLPPPHPPSSSSSAHPAATGPLHPIPRAADQLIHLFNAELQIQIQAERDSLRFERETLIRERSEIQRERELMQREREGRKSYEAFVGATNETKDKETMALREENQMLRMRVEELQNKLDETRRETGGRSPAITSDETKPP